MCYYVSLYFITNVCLLLYINIHYYIVIYNIILPQIIVNEYVILYSIIHYHTSLLRIVFDVAAFILSLLVVCNAYTSLDCVMYVRGLRNLFCALF